VRISVLKNIIFENTDTHYSKLPWGRHPFDYIPITIKSSGDVPVADKKSEDGSDTPVATYRHLLDTDAPRFGG